MTDARRRMAAEHVELPTFDDASNGHQKEKEE